MKKNFLFLIVLLVLLISSVTLAQEDLYEDVLIDLELENTDVNKVIRSIAMLSDANIVIGSEVSGTVTVDLKEVSLIRALNLVTTMADLDYLWDDNIIIVDTTENIKEKYGEKTKARTFRINYGDIDKITSIVSEMIPDTTIRVNEQNRELFVVANEDELEQVAQYVKELDKPRKQVMIDVRMEEISRRNLSNIGIGSEDLGSFKIIQNDEGLLQGLNITLPEFFNLLKKNGDAETLANPRLMALDGEEASLVIGDRVPFESQKIQGEQVVKNVEYREIGINLNFTPRITDNNEIILKVAPEINSIGSGASEGNPVIKTRTVSTTVRLQDNQTFAISGLIQDQTIEELSKIPILGDMPVLGRLFQNTNVDKMKTEIIIFITTRVIDDGMEEKAIKKVEEESEKGTQAEGETRRVVKIRELVPVKENEVITIDGSSFRWGASPEG